ncbi:signal peptidase I [Ereboglobus luteus]|uniref:Signal peptidase I n=1 Tax=Ereboglobus luteus TaxID=1796921 RepID=A0A2U8E000_9BACT|nr:signal peptidase I [Ereboglobus luteus]AWI08166.1 signal peptidase I [Ereboglobus luteus]
MFGLFTSPDKQMRTNARNWLDVADRVFNYRRDELGEAELADLQKKTETLRTQVREKAGAEKLKLSIEELEPVLRKTGGRIYPHSGLREWVEFFVVAAILLIGMRQFFVQPFKIPTNSMWPTYNGMVPEVHAKIEDEPGAAANLFRKITLGASAHRVDAQAGGELLIPMANGRLLRSPSKGRQWLVFPQAQYQYEFYVGNEKRTPNGATGVEVRPMASVSVPQDFDMRMLLRDALAPDAPDFETALAKMDYVERTGSDSNGNPVRIQFFRTGKYVKEGERALSFDIITGDQLFVDRMSYHFVRPRVGSGFVFRTTNIPGTIDENRNHIDSYYIKRLGGQPGDKLQVRNGVLYRNGAPITGAKAFDDNATRSGKYRGYQDIGLLAEGKTYTVSEDGYIALGDNSYNSSDSRYWGEVPKKDAVGRPLWVFYPFTSHWGPAK